MKRETRSPRLRVVLAALFLSAAIWLVVIAASLDLTNLIYLVGPVLASSIFLSYRATVAVTLINLLGFGVLALIAPPHSPPRDLSRPFTFYGLISGLILLTIYYRNRLEQDRQRQLAGSEALFRTLAEKALVGVYIIQDDRFRYVNPALAEIFGYRPDEIVAQMGPKDLTAPEDRPDVLRRIRKRLQGELRTAHYQFRGTGRAFTARSWVVAPTTTAARPSLAPSSTSPSARRRPMPSVAARSACAPTSSRPMIGYSPLTPPAESIASITRYQRLPAIRPKS